MTEQVPLDRLVLTLLALAEAAPDLPPGDLEHLSDLANDLEPTVKALSFAGLRVHTELRGQPAYEQAKAGWDALLPERYNLELDEKKKSLSNPNPRPSSGTQETASSPAPVPLETLEDWARRALEDPEAFAHNTRWLERLAGLVGQQWPRR